MLQNKVNAMFVINAYTVTWKFMHALDMTSCAPSRCRNFSGLGSYEYVLVLPRAVVSSQAFIGLPLYDLVWWNVCRTCKNTSIEYIIMLMTEWFAHTYIL